VYPYAPKPPAAARLNTNGLPTVPDCVPDGPIKLTSGLITKVGSEIAGSEPRLFVATTATNTNRPSSALVNKSVLEVAPVISEQVAKSAASVQDFHWYVSVGSGAPLKVTTDVSTDPTYGFPVGCTPLDKVGAIVSAGVTGFDATEATDSPFLLVALTVNVYAVPLVKPTISIGEEVPVADAPLLAVTV
jgi:hypothetical protein